MAMVINSNLVSLNTQRQLQMSRAALDSAMERLASGKRINSAADDAAGLTIASKMTSQVRGLSQAIRNANDGISMLQTAEGAMDESTNILQRMRELSIQAANGIYNDANRASLNAEYAQLVSEIDRIASTTKFNGRGLLNGEIDQLLLQVGAQANETVALSFESVDSYSLGLFSDSQVITGNSLSLSAEDGSLAMTFDRAIAINSKAVMDVSAGDSVQTLLDNINANFDGIDASSYLKVTASGIGNGEIGENDSILIESFDINGNEHIYRIGDTRSQNELATKITTETDGYLTAYINADGFLEITSDEAATLLFQDPTDGLASGINFGTTVDPGISNILEGLQSFWISESESLIEDFFGLTADKDSLTLNLFTDEVYGRLASISFTMVDQNGNATDLTLNIDLADYGGVALPDGDNGGLFSLDRVIAHEMVHALTAINTDYFTSGASLPRWFTEGTAELIHGADDRVNLEASFIDTKAEFDALFSVTTLAAQTNGSPQEPGAYSIAYLAAKYLQDAIFEATNGASGIDLIFQELKDGDTLDTAIKDVFTAIGNGNLDVAFGANWASGGLSKFQDDFLANGFNYYSGNVAFNGLSTLDLSDSDTGSIAGTDYKPTNNPLDKNGDGNVSANEILSNDPSFGGPENFSLIVPKEYSGDYAFASTSVRLRSTDGSDITIAATPRGSDIVLASFGFNETIEFTLPETIDYIGTQGGANEVIAKIDNALDIIAKRRGDIGAAMNRLDFSINNLANVVENASAARSRILDADYAAESAALWRGNVLQSAGVAMLAQANAAPNLILSLLGR